MWQKYKIKSNKSIYIKFLLKKKYLKIRYKSNSKGRGTTQSGKKYADIKEIDVNTSKFAWIK